jgi:hypothetical protein
VVPVVLKGGAPVTAFEKSAEVPEKFPVAVTVPTLILLVQVGVNVPPDTNICPLVPAAVNPVVFGAV